MIEGADPTRVRTRAVLHMLLVCLLLVVNACAPLTPPQEGLLPAPPGQGERLLSEWTARAGSFQALQGLAKVKVRTPEQTSGGTQVVIVRRPDRVRAETLSPFGTPLLLLATDGADLGVSIPSQNRFYFGKASAANIGRFIRLPIRPADLVNALLYNAPVWPFDELATWQRPDGGWLLKLTSPARHQELLFDARKRLVELRYYYALKLEARVSYGDFLEQPRPFPQRIDMELMEAGVSASLKFSELELDTEPKLSLFRLEPPPNAERINLDALEAGP